MEISLDYAAAREIVYLAVRRAAAFLGFGINAARNDQLVDFTLTREVEMHFLPITLSPEQISNSKRDFEQWIVSNGVRELIEGFSVYLDRLYEHSLVASMNGQRLSDDSKSRIAAVRNKGLPGKQQQLRQDFGIKSDYSLHLKTLYEARNCLSHERGLVTPSSFNSNDSLEISWRAAELIVIRDDGSEQLINLRKGEPPVMGPGSIALRTVERTKRVKAGEVIGFTAKDLAEICAFVFLAADSFLVPAIEYAKSKGVKIPTENANDAPAQP